MQQVGKVVHDADLADGDEQPRVTIEMDGSTVLIRASAEVDAAYTEALAHVVNGAVDAETAVVIDPRPIRHDDAFAGHPLPSPDAECCDHGRCSPTAVEAVASGVIRVHAANAIWTLDLDRSRFCESETPVELAEIGPDAWTRFVALCVTRTQLCALTADGGVVATARAHRDPSLAASA